MLGILDLRSIGYYKIKQGNLQQNLSKYYRFESADILCEQFNKFVNTLKKEKDEIKEKYSRLEPDNKRNMSDTEILDRFIHLDKTFLTDSGKKQVMDILYKYKDAFSLRDEIGACSNIEIEIDVTNSHSLLDHIMLRKKIKIFLIRKWKDYAI